MDSAALYITTTTDLTGGIRGSISVPLGWARRSRCLCTHYCAAAFRSLVATLQGTSAPLKSYPTSPRVHLLVTALKTSLSGWTPRYKSFLRYQVQATKRSVKRPPASRRKTVNGSAQRSKRHREQRGLVRL